MTVAVLCSGTELTRGELVNTNATWLAERLTELDFEVGAIDVVDDDRERIMAALRRLGAEHEVIVSTGGLGPTTDDLTTECVASVLGVKLFRDAHSLELIEERLAQFGRKMAASNAKQADFPEGAAILPNRNGTAPGFSVRIGRALAFFLPGVPKEMRAMYEESVAPAIVPLRTQRHFQVRLSTFGLPESEVNDRLAGIEASHGVTIGYRAKLPEIEVKVLARTENDEVARTRAESAALEVRKRLGDDVIFAEGGVRLPEAVGALLFERGLTLAAAESCTGGMVSELMTAISGSSRYFQGGAVVYSNEAKAALLDVDASLIEQHGAVSREVAIAMAEGARARLKSDLALSITGIAGPTGGTPEKPVGLVHYAVASANGVSHRRKVFIGDREQVRRRAAFAALALTREVVRHGHRETT
jgi:nicotinamide-nucleotide amidase